MTALKNGTPGPVVVELTADVVSQMVSAADQTYMSPVLTRSVPEASMIAEAAAALLAVSTLRNPHRNTTPQLPDCLSQPACEIDQAPYL